MLINLMTYRHYVDTWNCWIHLDGNNKVIYL